MSMSSSPISTNMVRNGETTVKRRRKKNGYSIEMVIVTGVSQIVNSMFWRKFIGIGENWNLLFGASVKNGGDIDYFFLPNLIQIKT